MGDYPVIVSEADDLGGQNGLLVSLKMYKKLIWPYHKRLFDFIKSKAKGKAYIFFHNDGAIYQTLPLLIEAGVDIINPWQVNCDGHGRHGEVQARVRSRPDDLGRKLRHAAGVALRHAR